MGEKYVAWAVIRGSYEDGFVLHRHGMIDLPDIGDTATFGSSLGHWAAFFEHFLRRDLKPMAYGVERFTYRPGSQGLASEVINLHVSRMLGLGGYAVRNTDWKRWFKSYVDAEGTAHFFTTPTEHEADAAGIALYVASVVVPRVRANSSAHAFGSPYLS